MLHDQSILLKILAGSEQEDDLGNLVNIRNQFIILVSHMKKNQDSALPETLLIEESDRLSEKIQALQKLLTQNPNLRVQDILFP